MWYIGVLIQLFIYPVNTSCDVWRKLKRQEIFSPTQMIVKYSIFRNTPPPPWYLQIPSLLSSVASRPPSTQKRIISLLFLPSTSQALYKQKGKKRIRKLSNPKILTLSQTKSTFISMLANCPTPRLFTQFIIRVPEFLSSTFFKFPPELNLCQAPTPSP